MNTLFDTIEAIVLFVVVLGGLVLLHELGHFVVARLARVRVLEFGIGFPPRAKVLRSKGETLYTLNWLPIGGFVKLEGEDGDEEESDPRSFVRAKLPIKLLILFAGVGMNLLLAVTIFTCFAWFATPFTAVSVTSIVSGSPAESAGLVSGDTLTAVNGERFDFYSDGSIQKALRSHAGEAVTLSITHADGTHEDKSVQLRATAQIPTGQGTLGVVIADKLLEEYTGRPLDKAVGMGVSETGRWFGLILGGLGDLVRSVATNPTQAPPVSGPVGIATSLGDVFRNSGLVMTIYVAGILSANLALVNVLPFPPLDGGRIFVLLLKAIPRYGAKISVRAERLTYAIGFVALFGFLIWITVFDVIRGLGGGAQ